MLAIEYGNLAEWVGAIGTVFAFIGAAIAFAYNLYAVRRDALKAQAVQFDAWVKYVEYPSSIEPKRIAIRITVEFANGSNQAIRPTSLRVFFYHEQIGDTISTPLVPPTDRANPEVRQFDISVDDPNTLLLRCGETGTSNIRDFGIEVRFNDASGFTWKRDQYGKLSNPVWLQLPP